MSVSKRFRDTDTGDIYSFEFEREPNGTFEIQCTEHPENPQGGGPNDHHLYSSGKVCVSAGHEPRSLDRAVAISHVFMKSFSHYVRTGHLGRTGGRVDV